MNNPNDKHDNIIKLGLSQIFLYDLFNLWSVEIFNIKQYPSSKFCVYISSTGIETATKDLQKENEDRLWQEGIIRHVPIVGNIVNWWSPKTKEAGVRGRSLNLTQGIVESTENIYKYHMQIPSGEFLNYCVNKSEKYIKSMIRL